MVEEQVEYVPLPRQLGLLSDIVIFYVIVLEHITKKGGDRSPLNYIIPQSCQNSAFIFSVYLQCRIHFYQIFYHQCSNLNLTPHF